MFKRSAMCLQFKLLLELYSCSNNSGFFFIFLNDSLNSKCSKKAGLL